MGNARNVLSFSISTKQAVTCAPTNLAQRISAEYENERLVTTRLVRGQRTRVSQYGKGSSSSQVSTNNKRGRDASQRLAVNVKRKRRVARDPTYDECDAKEAHQCADNWSARVIAPEFVDSGTVVNLRPQHSGASASITHAS
jgi:hypothetical protein